jgi:hypothetical protein
MDATGLVSDNGAVDRTASMNPVGGGWRGSEVGEQRFRIPVPRAVSGELTQTTAAGVLTADEPTRRDAMCAMPRTAAFASEIWDRLYRGLGFVVLEGFPVDATEPDALLGAYWLLGLFLGRPVSQSRKGDAIGRVQDSGSDISNPHQRGYESSAALPFHVDRTDVVGLLCIRPAAAGGLSRLVSARAVHDVLLTENPPLAAELYQPLPHDRRGEQAAGQPPWSQIPVFSQVGGSFAARYVRRFIEGSQRHEQAPRLTAGQQAALDAVDEILDRPGMSLDMDLRPGEVQLINNFTILHARTAFTDSRDAPRLLLRLWLAAAGSPELPPQYRQLYGATRSGSYRGGVWPSGRAPRFTGTPVDQVPPPALGMLVPDEELT